MTLEEKLAFFGLKKYRPVGKYISNRVYFHWSYYREFPKVKKIIEERWLTGNFLMHRYNVIKFDLSTEEVCLVACPGFNQEAEPEIWGVWNLTTGKFIKYISDNRPIYHHKWMMVKDNYSGFDVKASKKRSLKWKKKIPKDRSISSRIGRKKFWTKLCEEINIDAG